MKTLHITTSAILAFITGVVFIGYGERTDYIEANTAQLASEVSELTAEAAAQQSENSELTELRTANEGSIAGLEAAVEKREGFIAELKKFEEALAATSAIDGSAEKNQVLAAQTAVTEATTSAQIEEATATVIAQREALQGRHDSWKKEQERIAAERERAAAAAAAAAAQRSSTPAAAQRSSTPAASSAGASSNRGAAPAAAPRATGGVAYSFNSIGAANQSAIDSCKGFGDTTGWLGVASFSVHWHCGGSKIASLSPGQTIKINNGQYAGIWRANGLAYTLNGQVHTTRDVRALGGLQIQTCVGGSYSKLGYYSFTKIG